MKYSLAGASALVCVLVLCVPVSARSLRGALEDSLFGGQNPSFVTVDDRPLLSADPDPRRFGRPIFVTGSASLGADITSRLRNEVLSESAVVPVPSESAGFAYTYNPALSLFERKSVGLGAIFNERVNTLGQGVLAFGVTYIRQDFDTYNGQDISDLTIRSGLFAKDLPTGELINAGVVRATLDLDITSNSTAIWATYGVTSWLDFSFLIPITVIDFRARSVIEKGSELTSEVPVFLSDPRCTTDRAVRNQCRIADFTLLRPGTPFAVQRQENVVEDTKAGVGDMLLRTKARFFEGQWGAFGGLVEFTLPTGDEDNFLGDGAFKSRFLLLHSLSLFENRLNFHLNGGGKVTTETGRKNSLEYGSAVDFMLTKQLSLVAELTGSWRVDAEGLPDNFIDGSFGFKANLFQGFILSATFRLPATDDGLRSDLIYLAGLEYDF